MITAFDSDPVTGAVRWKPVKSIWIGSMTVVAIVLGPLFFSWDALAAFLVLSAVTLCGGHSVGMHRRLIHNSFECPLWLEYVLVDSRVLVGMAGPFGMMRQHDLRDWAQRQPIVTTISVIAAAFGTTRRWQLHCELYLTHGPEFRLEPRIANDAFYYWMERTWMWQQLPLAVALFAVVVGPGLFGGSPCAYRLCDRTLAHRALCTSRGAAEFFSCAAPVCRASTCRSRGCSAWRELAQQSSRLSGLGTHRAVAGSAGSGWWLILALQRIGLAVDIRTPETMPARPELVRIKIRGIGVSGLASDQIGFERRSRLVRAP